MKLNNWIEFIYGGVCGIFIPIITGFKLNDWQFGVMVFFIAIMSVSYHHIKNYLDKNEK